MSLVNALFSTLLFKANQSKFNRDKRNAQKTAYFKTGQKMKWAKKNKRRINGSREYQKQYVVMKYGAKPSAFEKFVNRVYQGIYYYL